MKSLFVSIMSVAAIAFSASAQEKRERTGDKGEMHQRGGMKDLNLTEAQKTQMKANREEFKAQAEALRANKNLSEAEMKEKMKSLHEQQRAKMEAILTPEQKAKMSEARFENKQDGAQNENRMAEMKEKLGLTDDQVSRLKAQ